jgi:cell division protein FtsQ
MARKSSPTILQEESYLAPEVSERESPDDTRRFDLDVEEESPFLRGQKRVSARRGTLPKRAVSRFKWAAIAMFLLCLASLAGAAVYSYGARNWRFRINSSDDIEISGTHNVPHAQIMEVLGGDIGRNIFFIPLGGRKAQLEKIPWVESANVMRFVPNRLVVEIHERTPVAFVRVGSRISLIDAGGTLMELPVGKQKYSFPVIVGIDPGEPLFTRAARMRTYTELLRQFDSEGAHYSQDLSEIDLSDRDDVRVLTNDLGGGVLVHLGASDFLSRYKIYVTHLQAWRQQFDKLDSVDLRYDHQIIVNPDEPGRDKAPELAPVAARAAMAAGASPAALIHAVDTAKTVRGAQPTTPATAVNAPVVHSAPASASPGAGRPNKRSASKHNGGRSSRHRSAVARKSGANPPSRETTISPEPVRKPAGPETTSAKGGSRTALPAGHAALDSKKPSPAVVKNSDQQDQP